MAAIIVLLSIVGMLQPPKQWIDTVSAFKFSLALILSLPHTLSFCALVSGQHGALYSASQSAVCNSSSPELCERSTSTEGKYTNKTNA